jgi:hypothetical protein
LPDGFADAVAVAEAVAIWEGLGINVGVEVGRSVADGTGNAATVGPENLFFNQTKYPATKTITKITIKMVTFRLMTQPLAETIPIVQDEFHPHKGRSGRTKYLRVQWAICNLDYILIILKMKFLV